ncbi:hypothetical protein ABB37_04468 [Leptomonas pyrrhocoris]|uniref:Uncharacterized protein n=1 Tax=Leptomonas pyrrhocoris TaxID=157538 RepID=A0A0M9G2W3_LEPPY|nr:hypothetical protein ABB37_04468 [Leptomonas pyrrhocoris]XP_015659557.1 hypothetical protein ABB37_04468 [Leptomonas pyrrhocoris]KPA81117.1 hypothetical protein ABB37_04468 [Leptomonas pyrrhocoris]KPA81118.1 hypothetical protein ABB37_04468 [Leptomonas pyrrhocoris]|eukprot:XP_015659556.1 hypothetical protein ABB37_04468 [Leptomonas pyrrhocoris]
MPPKRPLRRPPGPAVPPRTVLHTQQLVLFSSPAVGGPTKPPLSTNRRTPGNSSASAAAAPAPSSKSRSSSQRRPAPTSSSTSSTTAQRRPAAEYEPLPEQYQAVPCAPTPFLSDVAPTTASLHGGRVPSPPPSRSADFSTSSSRKSGGGGVVASGSSSRVVRLLRDARAAVQDPIRPETPVDSFGALSGTNTTTAASGFRVAKGGAASAAGFPRQPPHGLEPRLRRRLPAGGRLAPMPPPPQSSAFLEAHSASSSSTSPLQRSSPVSLPVTGLSSQIDVRAHSLGSNASPPATAATSSSSVAAVTDGGFDAESFAKLYAAAQQRGEEGLVDCANLLGQLKQWLAATSVAAAPHSLGAAATACVQATLLHFCEYWPTGAALRNAIDNYTALEGANFDATLTGDSVPLGRSLTTSTPLNYAEVALLAAAVMLSSYPPSSLVAEPISFHALLTALHTIAECGVAEWIAQESPIVEVLMEVLHVLTTTIQHRSDAAAVDVACRRQQWTLWILDIFACCCEEAFLAASASTTGASGQAAGSPSSSLGVSASNNSEQDMIRGHGLADDVTDKAAQGQQRVLSASLMSSTASLHRVAAGSPSQPGSHSPISSFRISQGSPLSLLRHGNGGEGGQRQQPTPLNALKALTTHLLSRGLLSNLQQLSADALEQQAVTTASSVPTVSLLPVIGSLYRLLAQFHAASLRASGVLHTLVSMLQVGSTDSATAESAARALVKLTFDEECLHDMREMGTTLLDAAAHALLTQMRLHADATTKASIELFVSRVCGVVARVAEGSAALQEHLATPAMTHVLEVLAQRYLAGPSTTADIAADSGAPPQLPPTPVVQAIVWVLGIAAMSPRCSLHLVDNVTPLLVSLLQRLRELPATQTTAIYVLMCLSNLSYFFNRFELLAEAVAVEGEGDVAAHAEWLPTICSALCFSLAAYLFEDSVEATVEATRILGNISYTNAGRDWMEANRCDEVVVIFLGHEDLRIVYNCCGILLNLTAASPCRVVEEPELLQMMLSYTARYTKDETIAAAAALERQRLRKQLRAASGRDGAGGAAEAEEEFATEASSSASQIADLVEKLLHNVKGLLALTVPTTGAEDI